MSCSVVALINPESIAYSHVVNYRLGESLESVDKATQWHLTLLIDSLRQAIECPNFSETPHANTEPRIRETKAERASQSPFVCCFVKRAVSGANGQARNDQISSILILFLSLSGCLAPEIYYYALAVWIHPFGQSV